MICTIALIVSKLFLVQLNLRHLLDLHQSVVLHDAFAARWSAKLHRLRAHSDREIRREIVTRLAAAVAHHQTPALGSGLIAGFDRRRNASDLVELDEKCVGLLLLG